ncbi:MAG: Helix-turn-helix domain [Verrucomicrobiota bacterium]
MSEKVLSVREYAEFLGVSQDTIKDMVAKGELYHLRVRYRILFTPKNIEANETLLTKGPKRIQPSSLIRTLH